MHQRVEKAEAASWTRHMAGYEHEVSQSKTAQFVENADRSVILVYVDRPTLNSCICHDHRRPRVL